MSSRRKCLFVLIALMFCYAGQSQTLSGLILDNAGEPVVGATVQNIDDMTVGAVSDLNGAFTINVQPGTMLLVSYIGYVRQEIAASEDMRIRLVPETNEVGEVVVQGMRSLDKRLFTGATVSLSADDVRMGGIADISRELEGRAAGVSVQNVSGTFGTAPKIRVRGATSIYGDSKPLWVIDGIIQEDIVDIDADALSSGDAVTLISNAIAGLNADDIESFQILKDGSATSIYGARAMAGVVVITTRRGHQGRSSVNYTGEFSYRLKPSYRNYNICDSQEQMGIYREMSDKGWMEFATLAQSPNGGIYGRMYNLISTYDEMSGRFGLPFTDAAMNAYLREAEYRNTDWFDELFNSNVVQNHSVSVSSGSDKAGIYASLSVMNDPGWTMDSHVRRYTANVNADFDLSKYVSVSLSANGSSRNQQAPGTLTRSVDVVSGRVSRSFDINPFSYALNTSRVLDPDAEYTRNYAPFNVKRELDNNYMELSVTDLKFQGEVSVKPLLGLEIRAVAAYRTDRSSQEHFVLNGSNQAEAYRAGVGNPDIQYANRYLYSDPDKPGSYPISVMPKGGIYTRSDYSVSQFDLRLTAQYNKVWRDVHVMNVFGGMEMNRTDRDQVYDSQYGVDYDAQRIVTITPEFYKQAKEENTVLSSFSADRVRNFAGFASVSYSYDDRYVANLTGRYEGSNKLGKARESRWLPTWNVSGAWNMHEEKWMRDYLDAHRNWLSFLRLRASYSLTADRGPASVSNALPIYYSSNAWRPQGNQMETVIVLSEIANKELTYEKKHEFNIGADIGFLDNRINLAVDGFWRNNYDLIGYTQTQGVGGMIDKLANVASMRSGGVELSLTTRNIMHNGFKWTTDLVFSYADNVITGLKSRSNVISLVTGNSGNHFREGYPVSALFSIPFTGLNDAGIPTVMNEKGEVTAGDINFQEYDKLEYLKYEGPAEPPVTGGLNNTFIWRNWRLNVFISYAFGNKVRLDPVFASAYSDMSAMTKEFKNRWVQPGDENVTDIPVIASLRQYNGSSMIDYAYNAYNYSTARVADGGFVRMKDISLTYSLPMSFLKRMGLASASLGIDATNLFLIYSDRVLNGQDPEFVNSGGVAAPLPKQFTFTVRVGL
ncbi:MAG: SusC/RagA family TonB-linked outer membrane protein [Bacteroidaceae bacterium]|nr:SusC/RagA family TonB-linked outer membrane protein [Bacteroidaceae bacterium]